LSGSSHHTDINESSQDILLILIIQPCPKTEPKTWY